MNTTSAHTGKGTRKDNRLVDSLNQVLADTYALLGITHLAHWNVEGSDFFQLHLAFETQYKELFEAVDEIAERVRALDGYAVGGLGTLARMADIEEFTSPAPQKDYIAGLVVAHEKLIQDAIQARELAEESEDLETQDLLIKRIQTHQKFTWMLKSSLK